MVYIQINESTISADVDPMQAGSLLQNIKKKLNGSDDYGQGIILIGRSKKNGDIRMQIPDKGPVYKIWIDKQIAEAIQMTKNEPPMMEVRCSECKSTILRGLEARAPHMCDWCSKIVE